MRGPAVLLAGCLLLCLGARAAEPATDQLMQSGALLQAESLLREALVTADTDAERRRLEAQLMQVLLRLQRHDEAQALLDQALPTAQGVARGRLLLIAGQLAEQRGQRDAARAAYTEAQSLANAQSVPALGLQQRAALLAARLEPETQRRAALAALEPRVQQPELLVPLGQQAAGLGDSALAYRAFDRVRRSSAAPRLQAQALEGLAGLYEADKRRDEALRLNQQALELLPRLSDSQQAELRVRLEFRQARLRSGAAALAAYQRAANQLEAVRGDWPIETESGQSSHQTLFAPLYQGLVDGLLRQAERTPQDQGPLRRARDAIEQLHQAEIQDYLGDRCEVDAIKGGASQPLPPGSAAIYPVLLADRVELLVEDAQGLALLHSPAPPQQVREQALALAKALRDRADGFEPNSRALYTALIRPLEPWLAARGIDTLVWVPDGPLRLLPMGALHDGKVYAVERWAIVSTLGLTMTNTQKPRALDRAGGQTLLAGAGEFGPVVGRLAHETWVQPLLRSISGGAAAGAPPPSDAVQQERLREALALPGVGEELSSLQQLTGARTLRDTRFTVQGVGQAMQGGGYRVVHLASHGVFGGSAATSYLLAYDDLLTLPNLQGLLQSDAARRQPIELLSLSACQTAEGNERAPLGLAGAAIKARARAVLGSLWPVDDNATVRLMGGFYKGWLQDGQGKAGALRQAQLALLRDPASRHPFYWAPFALIGNWL